MTSKNEFTARRGFSTPTRGTEYRNPTSYPSPPEDKSSEEEEEDDLVPPADILTEKPHQSSRQHAIPFLPHPRTTRHLASQALHTLPTSPAYTTKIKSDIVTDRSDTSRVTFTDNSAHSEGNQALDNSKVPNVELESVLGLGGRSLAGDGHHSINASPLGLGSHRLGGTNGASRDLKESRKSKVDEHAMQSASDPRHYVSQPYKEHSIVRLVHHGSPNEQERSFFPAKGTNGPTLPQESSNAQVKLKDYALIGIKYERRFKQVSDSQGSSTSLVEAGQTLVENLAGRIQGGTTTHESQDWPPPEPGSTNQDAQAHRPTGRSDGKRKVQEPFPSIHRSASDSQASQSPKHEYHGAIAIERALSEADAGHLRSELAKIELQQKSGDHRRGLGRELHLHEDGAIPSGTSKRSSWKGPWTSLDPLSGISSGNSTVKPGTTPLSSSFIQGGEPTLPNLVQESSGDSTSEDGLEEPLSPVTSRSSVESFNGLNLVTIPEGARPPDDAYSASPVDHNKILPYGYPSLIPFRADKRKKFWSIKNNIEAHIPTFMYSKILTDSDEAFQLWYPRPPLEGAGGSRNGVEVGDIVHLDDSGELRVIFNIFRSAEENKALGANPPPWPYDHLQMNPADDLLQYDLQKQKCYFTADNIENITDGSQSNRGKGMQFRIKKAGREGAIIALPHGGAFTSLRDTVFQQPKVKEHFYENAPKWYHHAISSSMPNLENGSLLLVRSAYCARTWGIAAFSLKKPVKIANINLLPPKVGHDRYEYRWRSSDGHWKTSVGPSNAELRVLQGREPPLNQCFGVVLSSIRVDALTWERYFAPVSTPPIPGTSSNVKLKRYGTKSSGESSFSDGSRKWPFPSFSSRKSKEKVRRASMIDQDEGYKDYTLLSQET